MPFHLSFVLQTWTPVELGAPSLVSVRGTIACFTHFWEQKEQSEHENMLGGPTLMGLSDSHRSVMTPLIFSPLGPFLSKTCCKCTNRAFLDWLEQQEQGHFQHIGWDGAFTLLNKSYRVSMK